MILVSANAHRECLVDYKHCYSTLRSVEFYFPRQTRDQKCALWALDRRIDNESEVFFLDKESNKAQMIPRILELHKVAERTSPLDRLERSMS